MRDGQVIVTGASRGIGAAITADLSRRGFQVVGLSRSGTVPSGFGMTCDVTDEAALSAAIGEIAQRGPIAGLVNNAGAYFECESAKLAIADLEKTLRLNATMPFLACRDVYPHLKAAGGGLIVNIGSFLDKLGASRSLAYAASKAAIGAMTRCLANEWAKDSIRVMDVAPGYIETDLNRDFLANEKIQAWIKRRVPTGRQGQPEEVGRVVGMLFAEDIGYLTGETIYLDGGQGMNL